MYFKKLEIIGFKSFAEKTKLNFEPGVTAIVGPNGCGKSNISDAIKWAFGEQSTKSLRASRMEDVIFNGTDQTEPINLAEVSVTFSNESKVLPIEYDEVTITRRLFRSGESEYIINKTPVRLKDVQELLMGTGIGTSSYSLIEQGQIDLILSSKPEERRYIFEEASGITKYKAKKKEALNKLAQTENNLLRVNDIITEVKRQIGSIERQARKAERYKQEFENLKDLDTKFSSFKYKNLKSEEKVLSVEVDDIRDKEKEALGKVAHFNEITEKMRADMELISEKFSALQATLVETSATVDKNSHKISVNSERIKELEHMSLLLGDEIKKAEERRASFEDTLKVLKQKVDDFTKEKKAKEDLVNQKEAEHTSLSKEIEAHNRNIVDGKNQTVENLARQSKFNNESTRLSADIQSRSSRSRRLGIEKEKVNEELSGLEAEFDRVNSEAKSVEDTLSGLNEKKLSCGKDLAHHKEKSNTFNEDLIACQKESSLLKSHLKFLEELIQNYEGFDKGARHITEAKNKGEFKEVIGPLCDIIDINEKLEVAFELALGTDLQSFIVRNREKAQELLSYLEANNLGSVSIIIVNDLPRTGITKAISRFSLRPLIDVAGIKDEHKEVLNYLLKDIYVAENEKENIFKIIDRLPSAAKVITADGKLIQRGRVCGGAARKSSDTSLLGREKKIEQSRFRIEKCDKKIVELNEALTGEKSILQLIEKETEEVGEKIRREEISMANINTKKEALEEQLNRLNDEKVLLETETEELNEFLQELASRQENLKKELKGTEEKQQALESLIVSSENTIEEKSRRREDLLVELTQYRTELASLSREEENRLENLTREESAFAEISSSIESKRKQRFDGFQRIKELKEENNALESGNSLSSSEKGKLQQDIEKIRNEKARLMKEITKEDEKTQNQKSLLEELRDDHHKIEMKKTELSYKQSSLKEKVLQSYKVDLDQAQIALEDSADWEDIRARIDELKIKLEKMGTVNLVAIEEHQELQERFNFLTHQHQDLLNAKESLLKAIQKINKTTRALFFDTFTKIQVEFKNFFRFLFGGGQAELLLMDERDILESGIEIIVRPPGKKLQNISLLSGGEKAMTAIALLFAIFKVKPSPFCVLDEIDAALDESNIGRFSNVLKDFVKNSQFIIVTHNKKTIELADIMYGITMQKSGISKIVSVKFADAKKDKEEASATA